MDFVPVLAMATLVKAIIDFIKYVRVRDTNGVATSLAAWVAGVIVVLLVAQTDFAGGIEIADRALGDYNTWSLVFLGLTISTIAQFGVEIIKAADNSDSAAKPDLVP